MFKNKFLLTFPFPSFPYLSKWQLQLVKPKTLVSSLIPLFLHLTTQSKPPAKIFNSFFRNPELKYFSPIPLLLCYYVLDDYSRSPSFSSCHPSLNLCTTQQLKSGRVIPLFKTIQYLPISRILKVNILKMAWKAPYSLLLLCPGFLIVHSPSCSLWSSQLAFGSLKILCMFLPQDLCSCCPFSWKALPSTHLHGLLPHLFQVLHLMVISQGIPDHPMYNCNPHPKHSLPFHSLVFSLGLICLLYVSSL